MRFTEDTLIDYKNVLKVMESLDDSQFKMVYLDPPYYSGESNFLYVQDEYTNSELKEYLAKENGCAPRDVTVEEVKSERIRRRNIQKKKDLQAYSHYIGKIFENTRRILANNGILCFIAPGKEYVDINYKLMLDQLFYNSYNVTIERRKGGALSNTARANHDILHFYAKDDSYQFQQLLEKSDLAYFKFKDDNGFYRLDTAFRHEGIDRPAMKYEWHGIIPPQNLSWRFSKEHLDELYTQGQVVIKDNKALIKRYRDEILVPVSSVWKADNNIFDEYDFQKNLFTMDANSMDRMFNLFTNPGDLVCCPYESDGKFTTIANKHDCIWVCVYQHTADEGFSYVDQSTYTTISSIDDEAPAREYSSLITNVSEIEVLKDKVEKLSSEIEQIQASISADETDEGVINNILDKMHQKVVDTVSELTIEGNIPEAKDWVNPYWDMLEGKSKYFLPTGNMLYKLFTSTNCVNMAPAMAEYCKTFELELFQKIFFTYAKDLLTRNVNIPSHFSHEAHNNDTKEFYKFLCNAYIYHDDPSKWHFELGKMIYVLNKALRNNVYNLLLQDFKQFLDKTFEQQFFNINFMSQLSIVRNLRNDCAHTNLVVPERVAEGKGLIREKLIQLLEYYK